MKYFDLHADTPSKLYYRDLPFTSSELDISAEDLKGFSHITQVFACFCNETKSDEEAYRDFFRMREKLFAEISPYLNDRFSFLLSVEDARLLAGDIRRLSALRDGVADSLGAQAVALARAHGDEAVDAQAESRQHRVQQSDGTDAIHIVIAVDAHVLAVIHCPEDASHGGIHLPELKRVS